MKKTIWFITIGILLLIIGLVWVGFYTEYLPLYKFNEDTGIDQNNVYPEGGRDTIDEFGNRRFAILKGPKVEELKTEWCLYDREKNESIENTVYHFKNIQPYVYTVGSRGCIKLDYETAEIKQSANISDFSKEDQEIFNKLEYTKDTAVKDFKNNEIMFEFNNGKFSIIRVINWVQRTVTWELKSENPYKIIEYNIDNFKEINSCVYMIGSKGYTRLSYEISEIKQSANISDFSKEDQEIFNKLEYTKDMIIKR